jgi:septal ring factor EnvC (AmiA/AmiB activator)
MIFFFLIRYDSVNTQRQRDKQRLTDLERNLNEERQNKQRLETQIKTEKTLTKKLQDDLTKLSLTPTKFVFSFLLSF